MTDLNIVLVEPEIPQNTGNIARTCAAIGATLHLVRPLGFAIDDRKMKRAGLDYWDKLNVKFYDSLADFMAAHEQDHLYFFTTKGQHCYTDVTYPDTVYLVFGRETRGLPEDLLYAHPDQCLRIPMRNHLRSLNLSNSVAVAAYEVLRQENFDALIEAGQLTQYTW
jgi:tRNA (cytidine/uridine-2'-O-)-methyltransferase